MYVQYSLYVWCECFQSRDTMLNMPDLREALMMFAQTQDPVMQKVVVKIIFCMMDTKELK